MAIFEGLVEYDPKTQQPIPAIAKSWEGSPNVDEFIFHLRDNAKWSDGTPITANDFVFSMRRAFDPKGLCNPGKVFPTPRLCGEVPGPYRQHPVERAGLAERY